MNTENVAQALKELGHVTRLSIYKRLVKAGSQGLPVGELQKELQIPASTLSHHIAALSSVNLLVQKREGRILRCIAQFNTLEAILAFLTEECCAEYPNRIQIFE